MKSKSNLRDLVLSALFAAAIAATTAYILHVPLPTGGYIHVGDALIYKTHADKKSLYNTPPTYNIYIVGKVIKWIQSLGGLEKMKEINEKKAAVLYDFLDTSNLFHGVVRKDSRSLMNVTFRTGSDEIDAAFVKAAGQNRIVSIKGHRSVGGMRASLYNAMPMEGVLHLIDFMKEFEKQATENGPGKV